MDAIAAKTRTLVEALPYIRRFHGAVFVLKYGGNVMTSAKAQASAMTDIVLLKHVGIQPVVVHGGGPEASRMMREAGIEPRFVNGLRVTDAATLDIVRRSFAQINRRICGYLKKAGGKPIGLMAARNTIFTASPKNPKLGFVGQIDEVDVRVVRALLDGNYIPVVSPLAADADGQLYNVNADTAATELACALGARKLTLMTNVEGVMEGDRRHSSLTIAAAKRLIKRGVISGGMIPKVEAAIRAVRAGVKKAHLIDGTTEHGILLEIFTRQGIGTEIVP
jgi:acetylglutamate kinase